MFKVARFGCERRRTIFRSTFYSFGMSGDGRANPSWAQMIDWNESDDIEAMLMSLSDGEFHTELRLFCAACASRVLHLLPEPEFEVVLGASRRFAAKECSSAELQQCVNAASDLLRPDVDVPTARDLAGSAVVDGASVHPPIKSKVWASVSCAVQAVACAAGEAVPDDQYNNAYDKAINAEVRVQCDLLRAHIPDPNV